MRYFSIYQVLQVFQVLQVNLVHLRVDFRAFFSLAGLFKSALTLNQIHERRRRFGKRGVLTLPFGHFPNRFCFIFPTVFFISPSKLLHLPKKMLHFPNSLLHFPNKLLHFPNSLMHFPMQCCVILPKKERTQFTKYCQFVPYLGLNFV